MTAHEPMVQALVDGLVRAKALIAAQPDRVVPYIEAALGKGIVDSATIRRALGSPATKFEIDPRAIIGPTKTMQDYQVTLGSLDKPVSFDGLFDTRFYERAPPPRIEGFRMRRARGTLLAGWGLAASGLAVFLLVWEAVPLLGLVNPSFLPPPSVLPAAFLKELRSGAWTEAVAASLSHYVVGLAIGTALGVALGVVTGMSRVAEQSTAWVVRLLRPIPGLAWVPFAILWFGVDDPAAVFIIAIGVFWIAYFAAHGAIAGVDRDLVEVAEAFGYRHPLQKLRKILLPAALPGILVGLRTALGQAWMAVVAAEIFGVAGLGQRMMQASSLLATEVVVVYMLTIAALYGLVDTGFVALQGWLLRWKR